MNNIIFDREKHQYTTIGTNKELTSVTTFIKDNFVPEFDTETIATRYAKKHNLSKKEVLAEWKRKADEGKARGNFIHDYIDYFFTSGGTFDNTKNNPNLACINNFLERLMETFHIVKHEFIVGDEHIGIAGTFDCLVRHKQSGLYYLLDWKTNKEIKFHTYFGSCLKRPFSFISNCNANIYALQLSLYKYLILKKVPNIRIESNQIIHFQEQQDKTFIKKSYLCRDYTEDFYVFFSQQHKK